MRRKKGSETKVFPAGVVVPNPTIEYYVANTNTNIQQATDDLAPTAGVTSKTQTNVAVVDLDKEENDMERLEQLEQQVGDLLKRVAQLEKKLLRK